MSKSPLTDHDSFQTTYAVDALQQEVLSTLSYLQQNHFIERLWQKDNTLWEHCPHPYLGWLNIEKEHVEIYKIKQVIDDIKSRGFTDIVLIGMGGSSVFPEALTKLFKPKKGYPRLHVLSSTHPSIILRLEAILDLSKTFFIISSKSGKTLETCFLQDYFLSQLKKTLKKDLVGEQFIAITDEGSPLANLAHEKKFHAIFSGDQNTGGRYSALSNFGMVPFGFLGYSIKKFLQYTQIMRDICMQKTLSDNPGVLLGILLSVLVKHSNYKIILILPPSLIALGEWISQLLAESTGKNNTGIIPFFNQPDLSAHQKNNVYIFLQYQSKDNKIIESYIQKLTDAGSHVISLVIKDKMHLGAELFRWEMATIVVSSLLKINPFDQPDIEQHKNELLNALIQFKKTKILPLPPISPTAQPILTFLKNITPQNYVVLFIAFDMQKSHQTSIKHIQSLIIKHKKIPVLIASIPQSLHTVMQAFLGGINQGFFLYLTANSKKDLNIPDYFATFNELFLIQSNIGFKLLVKKKRNLLRIHLEHPLSDLKTIENFLTGAL